MSTFGQLSKCSSLCATLMALWQWPQKVFLCGHLLMWESSSYLYTLTPQSSFGHPTIFIGQSVVEWTAALPSEPVQLHPIPPASKALGHLMANFWIMACKARFLAGCRIPRKLLSTGQVLIPVLIAWLRHLAHMVCPSLQTTGSCITAKLWNKIATK